MTSKFEPANQLLRKPQVKAISAFGLSLSFRTQSDKKSRLRFAKFNFSEKVQKILEIRLKKDMEWS